MAPRNGSRYTVTSWLPSAIVMMRESENVIKPLRLSWQKAHGCRLKKNVNIDRNPTDENQGYRSQAMKKLSVKRSNKQVGSGGQGKNFGNYLTA